MATIQVYKHGTETLLGTGDGTIDASDESAEINRWTKKPGLQVGTRYKLKSGRKIYPDANCTAINPAPPLATFDDVA